MMGKTSKVQAQLDDLRAGSDSTLAWSPLLLPLMTFAAEVIEDVGMLRPVVTELLRTDAEQVAMCKRLGIDYYATVHTYLRGADFRSRHLSRAQRAEVVERINSAFRYGGRFRCCVWHIGTGEHFHLQVPRGVAWGATN